MLKSTINESDITFHERVGFGASGEVYRVTWKSKDGDVEAAAKKIPIDPNEPLEDQIGLEIDILQRLNHKNAIKYYGHIITDKYVTIITEFAAKGSLFHYLKNKRLKGKSQLHSMQIHKWAIEAAKGIQHLKELCVVHRDVNSHNCLISADGTLKICDLGIANYLTSSKTIENVTGTVKWMAPELFEELILSPKSDVFAFGIVLWELVACDEPYKGDAPHFVMYHVAGKMKLRPDVPKKCPVGYKTLMEQCWDGDRNKRPDIHEVVARLEAHDDSFNFASGPPGKPRVSCIGFTSMTVHWDPPADDGGSSITGYRLELRDTSDSSNPWKQASKDLISTTSMKVDGLAQSTKYEFRTSAKNVPASVVSDQYMTKPWGPGPPGKPQVIHVNQSNMRVYWTPPEGCDVTSYIVEWKEVNNSTNCSSSRVFKTYINNPQGLNWMAEYHFRVRAENSCGQGTFGDTSDKSRCPWGDWQENFDPLDDKRRVEHHQMKLRAQMPWSTPDTFTICSNGDVATEWDSSVKVYGIDGKYKTRLDMPSKYGEDTVLGQIAVNTEGTYFVTDNTNYVNVFAVKGSRTTLSVTPDNSIMSKRSISFTEFSGLTIDSEGNLLVGAMCPTQESLSNTRGLYQYKSMIVKLKQDGSYLDSFEVNIHPNYLAVTNQNAIIVSSGMKKRPVQIIDNGGWQLGTLNRPPGIPETEWRPRGVCCQKDTIFIANSCPRMSSGGIYCFSVTGDYKGCILTDLDQPRCLAVTEDGQKMILTERGIKGPAKVFLRKT